jgi:hypothetical protein
MLLKEGPAQIAICPPYQREWAIDNVRQDAVGNSGVVGRQLSFGDVFARINNFVRMCKLNSYRVGNSVA